MTPEARREALARGAKDFVSKPFHADEVLLRIRTLLETRFLYFQVQSQNTILEAKVRDRTRELEAAQEEIMERLARAAEFRDDNTGQHTERVGQMAALLARQLGLTDPQVSLIRRAAPLHDVGKIGVPDSILLKPGKLTVDEFEQVKKHTTIGARILSGSRFNLLRLAEEIAFQPSRAMGRRWLRGHPPGSDSARRPDRGGGRRLRRAHAEAPLQGGMADCRGGRGNRPAAVAPVRSRGRGRLPARDRPAGPRHPRAVTVRASRLCTHAHRHRHVAREQCERGGR